MLTEDGAGSLLRLSGRIDRETVRRFRLEMPPSSWPERVDLEAVTALETAGLELLVHLARKPRRRGSELQVLHLPDPLRPTLERAGLSWLLPRPDDRAAPA
ncbi:anti-anti-sigma regulatory factor [Modestobacter roseus]|uniref:Anti-anti-sigma regulatory factor n=1 Tax=Modestobacter roseus TaxID=1181884 RepID=A0A562IX90_9ACTN|nr:anti-anti-sigma regulatory factor [Modestobacter roseus]